MLVTGANEWRRMGRTATARQSGIRGQDETDGVAVVLRGRVDERLLDCVVAHHRHRLDGQTPYTPALQIIIVYNKSTDDAEIISLLFFTVTPKKNYIFFLTVLCKDYYGDSATSL